MRRFFTDPENIQDGVGRILEDANHITRVLRMKENDEILLFDGTGYEYIARLTEVNSKECVVEILEKRFSAQEPETQIVIFQGIPKSGKMESIIQKSVELGVSSIIPTALDRCVAKLDSGKKEDEKRKRWQKIALEAAKQCGRGKVPEILPSMSLAEAITAMKKMDLALMPYEVLGHQGEQTLKETLEAHADAKTIGVLIGPEGGFSDEEAEITKANGVLQIGLGKRILRTETVAAAMLSMILYEKNEL